MPVNAGVEGQKEGKKAKVWVGERTVVVGASCLFREVALWTLARVVLTVACCSQPRELVTLRPCGTAAGLAERIVLLGGGAHMRGFAHRLLEALNSEARERAGDSKTQQGARNKRGARAVFTCANIQASMDTRARTHTRAIQTADLIVTAAERR